MEQILSNILSISENPFQTVDEEKLYDGAKKERKKVADLTDLLHIGDERMLEQENVIVHRNMNSYFSKEPAGWYVLNVSFNSFAECTNAR